MATIEPVIQWTISVDSTGVGHIRDSLARHRPTTTTTEPPASVPGSLGLGFTAGPQTIAHGRVTVPNPAAHAEVVELVDAQIRTVFNVRDPFDYQGTARATFTLNLDQVAALTHCLRASRDAPWRPGGTGPTRHHLWAGEALKKLPSVTDLISAIGALDLLDTRIEL